MATVIVLTKTPYWRNLYQHAVRQYLGDRVFDFRSMEFGATAELPLVIQQLVEEDVDDLWCLIDPGEIRPDDFLLSRASLDAGWLAELILSFPQVGFLITTCSPPAGASGPDVVAPENWGINVADICSPEGLGQFCGRLAELGVRSADLFDESGTRGLLREAAWLDHEDVPLLELTLRPTPSKAVSVDDEDSYALIHAHACYTAGLSVSAISSHAQLNALIGKNKEGQEPPVLLLMDWDIRFSDLRGRNRAAAGDDAEDVRASLLDLVGPHPSDAWGGQGAVLVISALEPATILHTIRASAGDSLSRIRDLHKDRFADALRKPVGGLIHVWQLADSMIGSRARTRLRLPALPRESSHDRHSAPYRRHVVAGRLISRARRLLSSGGTPELSQCIQAAVLAYDARLLLGGLARTTGFEALALQFEAEVRAELSFLGFAGALDSRQRLVDLERFAGEAGYAEHASYSRSNAQGPGGWDASISNFLVVAIDRLRRVYAEHDQVDAADECLVQICRHQRRLLLLGSETATRNTRWSWFTRSVGRVRRYVRYLAVLYFDWSTRCGTSIRAWFQSLLVMLLLNAVALVIALALTPGFVFPPLSQSAEYLTRSLYYSVVGADAHSLMSSMQADSTPISAAQRGPVLMVEGAFRVLIGIVHVGILLGLLYRRLTRRAA